MQDQNVCIYIYSSINYCNLTQRQGKKEKDIKDSLMDLSIGSLSSSVKDSSLEENETLWTTRNGISSNDGRFLKMFLFLMYVR